MSNEIIEVILTGGRLEKVLNEEIGRLVYTDTVFKSLVEQARCTLKFQKHALMLKDSREINEVDLEAIAACAEHTAGKRVIISHGIHTLIRTAQYLQAKEIQKTIVLFGAFVPFSLNRSDALFNFGAAAAAVQCLPIGVHVVMNGQLIPADKALRDPESGEFIAAE